MIVGGEQPMTQLVEKIAPLVGDMLMLSLQDGDGLAQIGTAFLPSSDTALRDTQAFLGSAIPGRMRNVFAVAGGNERRKPHIDADIDPHRRQRLWGDFARHNRIPLARFAGESKRFDRPRHLPMPADSHATNTSNFEPTPIDLKPIAILLEPETFEAML